MPFIQIYRCAVVPYVWVRSSYVITHVRIQYMYIFAPNENNGIETSYKRELFSILARDCANLYMLAILYAQHV